MIFLTFNNANIQFIEKKLIWRFYTTIKALPNTKQIDLTDKNEFAKVVLNKESKMFVMYVAALKAPVIEMLIYLAQKA